MRILTSFLPVVLLVIASGCRTYGGHGSEEAAFEEIGTTLERYEARAQRMAGDYDALTAAATANARLTPFIARLSALVEAQEVTLADHAATAASVTEGSGYRKLHRALGSMISEQQVIEDQYLRLVAEIVDARELAMADESRYALVPARVAGIEASLGQMTIRDAVRGN